MTKIAQKKKCALRLGGDGPHLADLGGLARDQRWRPLPDRPGEALWTDDFSNILSVFNWKSFNLDRLGKLHHQV